MCPHYVRMPHRQIPSDWQRYATLEESKRCAMCPLTSALRTTMAVQNAPCVLGASARSDGGWLRFRMLQPAAQIPATLVALAVLCLLPLANAQDSSLQWQPQHAPATPGNGAIVGGPGDSPEPGSPFYVCRAAHEGGLYPGKWVKGSCNIALDGQDLVESDYEVAVGHATWGGYQGHTAGLLQTGKDADGSPLYSCRTKYHGFQPGKLTDGKCSFAYDGREIVQRPPFEVLYASGSAPPATPAATSAPETPRPATGATAYKTISPSKNRNDDDDLSVGGNSSSCLKTAGAVRANELVRRCLKVSPATHPPCNAENACSLIRDEIKRGCGLLRADAPQFCEQYKDSVDQ